MKILTARFVLPISGPILENAAVCVEDERIVDLGDQTAIRAKYPSSEVEDFPHAALLPGLINAHTHLDLLHYQGTGETPDFFNWLVGGWDHRKKLTPTDRRHCLDEGIRQMLRSGTTAVGDAGQYVGVIAQVVNSPMRMVLFPEILTGGDTNIMEGYEGAFSQVDEILGTHASKVGAGIAPYAAYTLSRHLLKILSQQARALRIPIKIHVSETFSEMQFFYESSGEIAEKLFPRMGWSNQLPPEHRQTPVQYLDSIGFLENAPTLVGCNHLADPDLQTLARTKTKIVHAPRANAHLKLGRPPIKKLQALQVPVALGTDGTAGLYSLSLWEEMRYIHDHYPEAEQPTANEILRMATWDSARALGISDRVGTIEKNKEADLIAVRFPKEATAADLAKQLIAHTTDRDIAAVFVEGKRVKL